MTKLVAIPSEGFANRMRFISSAYIYAKKIGAKLEIAWVPSHNCNINFNDFMMQSFPIDTVQLDEVHSKNYLFFGIHHVNSLMPAIEQELTRQEASYIIIQGGHEFVPPSMSESEFIEEKKKFYKIMFSHMRADVIPAELDHPYVSIHVRCAIDTYDKADLDNSEIMRFHETSPLSEFARVINNMPLDTNFLVFSNNPDVPRQLQLLCPLHAKCIRAAVEPCTLERNNKSDMKKTISEFIKMSNGKKIIGTFMSSFSDEAAYLGGIQKIVPVSKKILETKPRYHCLGLRYFDAANIAKLNN